MQRLLKLVLICGLLLSAAAHADVSLWDKIFGAPTQSAPTEDALPMLSPSELGLDAPAQPGAAPSSAVTSYLPPASDYKLGAGDHITVTVFNEKELSIDTRLSDAGTFSYPLLGEVRAQGMTIGQLQEFLTQQLKDGYLVSPQVYVSILEYRQFFVNGEVSKPGGYPYVPGLTVRKAISLAGGFTARASYTKISVIHEDDPLARPRPTSLNSFLNPGDIVTVDQSFF